MALRTRIKMCGMTRIEDVQAAEAAGADAIGLVFYPPSSRAVSIEQAQPLAAAKGLFMQSVALVVDEDPGLIRELLQSVNIDIIQFHGNESADFCQQFGKPYIKALRARSAEDIRQGLTEHDQATAIMLDAYVKGVPGGTGQVFDWSLIPEGLNDRLVLAGGLTADNVAEAIMQIRPYAVDVSGGIEATKGIKSAEKMQCFAQEVARVN
ncbi:MAG: phosphoribosylanthranilate isomerase [Reinekea sp.]|jgi:phosphoribosylanthranilate isomerase